MDESTTREKVLKKIWASLLSKNPNPFPKLDFDSSVFTSTDEDPVLVFGDKFSEAGGKFFLIADELEFAEGIVELGSQHKWKNIICYEDDLSNLLTECEIPHLSFVTDIAEMDVAVTSCECLISRSGTVVVSSRQQTRSIPAYAPVHIVLARTSEIVPDIKSAFAAIKRKYDKLPSGITLITGPSKTADIEGQLVTGVHGAKEIFVFLIDDRI